MAIVTSVVLLVCGIILCFSGYRSFRTAMSIAGFVIGAAIGMLVHGFLDYKLSTSVPGIIWLVIFMLIGGCILGGVSFRLYKIALFYVTMFAVSITVLRIFLLTTTSGAGIYTLIMSMFGISRNQALFGPLDKYSNPNQWMSGVAKDVLKALPGQTVVDKFWVVLILSLLVGAIAGVVVCAMQKPAIIVVTSIFGGMMLSQAICTLIGIDWATTESMLRFSDEVSQGTIKPEISVIIALLAIVAGIITQAKLAKKEPERNDKRIENS